MIRTTQWKPDTCGCILEYDWDDSLPDNDRICTLSKVISQCPEHSRISTGLDIYNQVLRENRAKNRALALAQSINNEISLDDYLWSFKTDRRLSVSFLGKLTAAQKTQLQNICDSELGEGLIEVI
jgi:hypothetical protein